jgi:Fe-Mn family superoxide dismutase
MDHDIKTWIRLLEAKEKPKNVEIEPLRYKLGDLSPVLSEENVDYHYNVLSKGYADRYNKGEGDPDFNLGGTRLHNLFWMQLKKPSGSNAPTGHVKDLIESKYKSYADFQETLTVEAMKIQGSGWIYLAKNGDIKSTPNQSFKSDIVMPIDMWEHSFMDYMPAKDAKKRYIKNVFKLIEWQVINDRFNSK